MKIGVDIDHTLTDIKSEISIAMFDYAKSLGKKVGDKPFYIEDVKDDGRIYQEYYDFTYEELMYFMSVIQEQIFNNATPRKGAREALEKLRKENDKIYIVTARDTEFHKDPYLLSEAWLKSNNIPYDKLIVNVRNKIPVCVREKLNVFIDDKLSNCVAISKVGIKTIQISSKRNTFNDVETFTNWNDIYNYIEDYKKSKK